MTTQERCPKCGGEMRVLGGCSAHPDNWYCKDEKKCGYQAWTARQNRKVKK